MVPSRANHYSPLEESYAYGMRRSEQFFQVPPPCRRECFTVLSGITGVPPSVIVVCGPRPGERQKTVRNQIIDPRSKRGLSSQINAAPPVFNRLTALDVAAPSFPAAVKDASSSSRIERRIMRRK